MNECRRLGGCKTGQAKITRGYRLSAPYVIHTVGPVWRGGTHGEPEMLASCYEQSLLLAAERNISSVAFPSISTGVYGYPISAAARIAVATTSTVLKSANFPAEIIFCCFSQEDLQIYERELRNYPNA